MKKLFLLLSLFFVLSPVAGAEVLKVVTTTTDLASIVGEVGGEKVEVQSIARGDQDLHYVEARPSMVVMVRNADLVVLIGMDQDVWVHALINSARNRNLRFGQPGYLDVSANIVKKEVPEGRIDASKGHIHIYGNPHYWLDPLNGKIIARDVADRLVELRPGNKEYFEENLERFNERIDEKLKEWKAKMSPFERESIVVHHKSFPYFADRFGLEVAGALEPKPGLPPSTAHLRDIIALVEREEIKVVVSEIFHNRRPGRFVAENTGAKAIVIPSSVGGTEEANDYFGLFDVIIDNLKEAFSG